MIKFNKNTLIVFVVAFILMFISSTFSYAQEHGEEEAKKLGITFPISELGNCSSFSACKAYCDVESNRDQCISFAKKKGFYKGPPSGINEGIIKNAQSELGCDSEASCRVICEKEENAEKCSDFASKHGLGGGSRGKSGDKVVLQKAKEILGCDSEATCKSVCENPANQEKCSNFAKATGLGGGIKRVGPGGCNSEESCRAFCEKNMDECRKFGGPPEGHDGGRRGPGGCNSEESCMAYCQSHPEECGSQGGQGPAEFQERFCKENPDKCSGGTFGEGGQRMSPEDFCRQNPDKCRGGEGFSAPSGNFNRPPEEYRRSSDTTYSTPAYEGAGETKTGETQYPTPSYETPSYTTPPTNTEVKGISTATGLLQQFLNWLGF